MATWVEEGAKMLNVVEGWIIIWKSLNLLRKCIYGNILNFGYGCRFVFRSGD